MLQQCSFTLFALITIVLGENPHVTLPQGTLKGSVMKSAEGREFQAFRGIPYAKPPIEELRFKQPEPAEPWQGVLDASKDGPACPQFDMLFLKSMTGQEDCLILNVYKPHISTEGRNEKLPVMFYIHGGAFLMGSSQYHFSSPVMFMDRDIVLVTINYRLGALGFLSTGDEESPGNYGLYDQVEALKWVKENIASFGGDPDKVTIFGVSAGAGSVSHLVISPKAKGLFHAAIMQSGTSLNTWAINDNPLTWAKALAIKLGCSVYNSKNIIDCIRSKSADEIILAQQHIKIIPFSITYVPVVENTPEGFLPEHPLKLLASNKINKVPTIAGVTQDEGAFHFAYFQKIFDYYSPEFLETDLIEIAPTNDVPESKAKETREAVKYYFKNVDRSNKVEVRKALIKLFSDGYFTAGAEIMVQHLSQNGFPTYAYMLTHKGSNSIAQFFGATEDYGVSHGDDIQYLFGSLFGRVLEGVDKEVSEIMLNLWTNFARIHDPTPGNDLSFKWLKTESTPRYLDINIHPKMVNKQLTDNTEFWIENLGMTTSHPSIKYEL